MAQEDENERGRGANARMRFRQSAGQERENVRKASRSMRLLIAVDAVLFLAILIAGGMLLYRRQNREAEQHLSEIQAPDWYTQDFSDRKSLLQTGNEAGTCAGHRHPLCG